MDTIHLLNTSILPAGAGHYVMDAFELATETARRLVADRNVQSHVGHASTADIMSEVLGRPVAFDRTPLTLPGPGDGPVLAVVLQLRGRPPEGVVMDREAIEAVGYDLRLLQIWRRDEYRSPVEAKRRPEFDAYMDGVAIQPGHHGVLTCGGKLCVAVKGPDTWESTMEAIPLDGSDPVWKVAQWLDATRYSVANLGPYEAPGLEPAATAGVWRLGNQFGTWAIGDSLSHGAVMRAAAAGLYSGPVLA